jgi:hypothetical protein
MSTWARGERESWAALSLEYKGEGSRRCGAGALGGIHGEGDREVISSEPLPLIPTLSPEYRGEGEDKIMRAPLSYVLMGEGLGVRVEA